MTFDLGHVLVLAWEELREQAVPVNEIDYLARWTWSYGEAKGQATGRRKVGDCVEVMWV